MPAPKNNNQESKVQPSLIPLDIIIPMLEPAYREGILKYQRDSWREGFNSTVMYDALMRHLTAWFFELESYDPESKEKFNIKKHHLGAAIFCLINLYDTDMNFPGLDDRPLKVLKRKNQVSDCFDAEENSCYKENNYYKESHYYEESNHPYEGR